MIRLLPLIPLVLGCTSLVPATALKLRNLDPLTADPANISVAVDLPEGLGIMPGSVILTLSSRNAEGQTLDGAYALDETRDSEGRRRFQIAPEDQAELRALQSRARAWEEADPDGTFGSISISVEGCQSAPDANFTNARASVYISLAPDAPAMPLFRNAPLSQVLAAEDLAMLPPCPQDHSRPNP